MLDGSSLLGYTPQSGTYKSERLGRVRLYENPGRPRKAEMKLAEWLDLHESEGKTRTWLALELGTSVNYVHQWCSGRRRPSAERIDLIAELTSNEVTLKDWLKPAKSKD